MKVFMTGGTGFVGTALTERLVGRGHQVTLLTRQIPEGRHAPKGASFLEADPAKKGAWQERVADHDTVINLAGATIFGRWNKKTKEIIRASRIRTTENLVEGLSRGDGEGTVLISTSAVGYYGFCGDEDLDESSPPGTDFLATLAKDWEAAAMEAEKAGVRVVVCRFGIVLGRQGGALGQMLPTFRKYLGSPLGTGRQWVSWIHEEDLADIYLYLTDESHISGPINCTAPNPVTNRDMTKALGEVLGKPTFIPPVPAFAVKMMLGEFGSVLLEGQKVLPRKLLDLGFQFRFQDIREALADLLGR